MSWLMGFILLMLGFIAGLSFYHWTINKKNHQENQTRQRLTEQLDGIHKEYAAYQNDIDVHFYEMQRLLEPLKQCFAEIEQRMAFDTKALSQRTLINKPTLIAQTLITTDTESLHPPKDYAPKKTPNERGTLSENFGLKEDE